METIHTNIPLQHKTTVDKYAAYKSRSKEKIVKGLHLSFIRLWLWLTIAGIAYKKIRSLKKAKLALSHLDTLRREYMGDKKVLRFIKSNGRYFWDMVSPGFPSKTFNRYISAEIDRFNAPENFAGDMKIVMLAITKKCPLQCAHCFEWDALNKKETVQVQDLIRTVQYFQQKGTGQFQLGGGEPLNRFDELITLLQNVKTDESDFWISTSGYGMTKQRAQQLKAAGLTGVSVSIDHFDEDAHNNFRGNTSSFAEAIHAVKHAQEEDLVVSLSLCATKEFISENNLFSYTEFARSLSVHFIQLIEPRAAGHYAGKDVELNEQQNNVLENFMLAMNYDEVNISYPLVTYHGFYQRKYGCFGFGNRYLYIDTDGNIQACPFCGKRTGNVLTGDIAASIKKLQQAGCGKFASAAL